MDVSTRFRKYLYLERKSSDEGLSPAELQQLVQLKRSLSRDFSPGLAEHHSDARSSVRVPTRLAVSFNSFGALQECLMTNLSRGGLFVATDHLVDIGTRLLLRVVLQETGEQIEIPAEVTSHNLSPRMDHPVHGMGMRFLELRPDVQKQVDELYERAGLHAAGPAADPLDD